MGPTNSLTVKKFKKIPGPPRIPIWGSLYLYKLGIFSKEKYHNVLQHLFEKYGPLVREDIGPGNTIIHVFDPKDAKTVFANEGAMPVAEPLQETTQLYRKKKKTSPGLGNTNGEEWYRLRKAVQKVMLKPKEVQRHLPEINQISEELITRLKERRIPKTSEIPNLRQEIAKWSREVSGWICFGKSLHCFQGGTGEAECERMIQLNRKIFKLSSDLKFSLPIYKYFPTPKWRELVKMEEMVDRYAVNLINEAIKENEKQQKESKSFISYLLSRRELTAEDVHVLVLSILGDALTTTTPSLIYNLYCLAVNPKAQERVRDEVRTAVGEEGFISADIIANELKFLKACVKETFRLYPIGTDISRVVQKDVILSNYMVPKGTHVHLNQIVQYKSEKYFKQPEEFQPERWLRDGFQEEIDPLVLVPFGHGARTCAGRRFAEQDLYVSLAKILFNFKLEYPEHLPPLKQIYEVLLFPQEPIQIKFKDLTN